MIGCSTARGKASSRLARSPYGSRVLQTLSEWLGGFRIPLEAIKMATWKPQSDELVVSSMFFYEITPTSTWGNDEKIDSCCSNGLVQPPTKKNICHIFGGLAWRWNFSSSLHLSFFWVVSRMLDVGCFFSCGLRYFWVAKMGYDLNPRLGTWWFLTEILHWIQAVGCFYPRIRGEPVGRFIYIYVPILKDPKWEG